MTPTSIFALEPTSPLWIAAVVLSAARVTRLVTVDTVTERFRAAFTFSRWSTTLVHCPWCAGFWISAGHVAVAATLHDVPAVVAVVVTFALSEAVGIIETVIAALENES